MCERKVARKREEGGRGRRQIEERRAKGRGEMKSEGRE
jgi:hypothetical protein